jgi:hypothetical protein
MVLFVSRSLAIRQSKKNLCSGYIERTNERTREREKGGRGGEREMQRYWLFQILILDYDWKIFFSSVRYLDEPSNFLFPFLRFSCCVSSSSRIVETILSPVMRKTQCSSHVHGNKQNQSHEKYTIDMFLHVMVKSN